LWSVTAGFAFSNREYLLLSLKFFVSAAKEPMTIPIAKLAEIKMTSGPRQVKPK
jgi:hypothetical protein